MKTIQEQAQALKLPDSTPWGDYEEIEPTPVGGIIYVRTMSHGGYWADEHAVRRVHQALPSFVTFAGFPNWFEHDEDWAALALAVPAAFSTPLLRAALMTARCVYRRCRPEVAHLSRWRDVPTFLDTPDGRTISRVVEVWEHDHRDFWERCSCWTDSARDCWQSIFRNIGDSAQQRLIAHRHYVGSGALFSTEQLDQMARDAATITPRRHPNAPAAVIAHGGGIRPGCFDSSDTVSDADPGL